MQENYFSPLNKKFKAILHPYSISPSQNVNRDITTFFYYKVMRVFFYKVTYFVEFLHKYALIKYSIC